MLSFEPFHDGAISLYRQISIWARYKSWRCCIANRRSCQTATQNGCRRRHRLSSRMEDRLEEQSETATAKVCATKTLRALFRDLTSGETTERCLHPECVCQRVFRWERRPVSRARHGVVSSPFAHGANNFPLYFGKDTCARFRTDPEQGSPPRMHTLKKVFHSVIANPHDGLTSADRLLRARVCLPRFLVPTCAIILPSKSLQSLPVVPSKHN